MKSMSLLKNDRLMDYLRWNSYRSVRYKLLYIATPKAACTSLKWWFADLEGYTQKLHESTDSAETDPDLIIHDTFYKVAPEITGLMPNDLVEPLTSDSYFRFAIVRNPYKRIFSAWQSKLLLREPLQSRPYWKYEFFNQQLANAADISSAFEGFLEHLAVNEVASFWDVHWTPQVTLLCPDVINYSKLVKIENSVELSSALEKRYGGAVADPFVGRHANESLIPYLPELLTSRASKLIQSLYADDFETFGYSREIPPANEAFTEDQMRVAIKAVELIRGRHKRFGDVLASIGERIAGLKQGIAERDERIASLEKR
ncbi:MAG: sulfotransferase family 2 domain-containing protein [Nitrospirota bacterium]